MALTIELNDTDLTLLKQLELSILEEFDRICRKYDIKYSLAGGTLIGAIRHKGFIPWDDDIDVIMLRKDYDFFRHIAKQEFDSEKYMLVNYESDMGYGEPFTKMELRNTIFKEVFVGNSNLKLCGVFIDIFPMDNVPNSRIKRTIHRFKNYELRKRILIKCGYDFNKSGVKKILYNILKVTTFSSKDRLVAAYNKNATRFNNTSTKNVVSLAGSYGYLKETRPAEYFKEYIEVDFEGKKYLVIKQYDQELKRFYGDYMKLPPIEKRVAKHEVQTLDLSYYGGRKSNIDNN